MPANEVERPGRRDPDALLRHVQAAERAATRGTLKVFLGYASGVGKSFRMFDEARRRHDRGQDVVIAAVQRTMPPEVADIVAVLESVPAKIIDGIPVIDTDAVLARRPQLCVVDGLAYDNPTGSPRPKRYLDVEVLLAAGIAVLASLNLEYIDEQQVFVRAVTGTAPAETLPQAFIDGADEVVIVDAPPEASTSAQAQQLSQLRQRALLLTADVVDRQLEAYLEVHGVRQSWGTQERIAVCMTPRANAAAMLASGRRNADRFHGELLAIYVSQANLTPEDRSALARNVMLARAQQAHVHILEGKDPIGAILEYARKNGITQLFVGHNLRRDWRIRLTGSLLDRLIDEAEGLDVRVFPH
jgi:two-component system, OmpR family, sensor histidine kinase KdpD